MIFKMISTGLLAFLIGFGSGCIKGTRDTLIKAQADKTSALNRLIKQNESIAKENDKITADWMQQQQQHRVIVKTVIKQVIKYVPKIQKIQSACSLTAGASCLLDAARLDTMPVATCASRAIKNRATVAAVTEAGLIAADFECADKYNRLRAKHLALVRVINNYQQQTQKRNAQ